MIWFTVWKIAIIEEHSRNMRSLHLLRVDRYFHLQVSVRLHYEKRRFRSRSRRLAKDIQRKVFDGSGCQEQLKVSFGISLFVLMRACYTAAYHLIDFIRHVRPEELPLQCIINVLLIFVCRNF